MNWRTSRRTITIDRPLVMGILNVTPDSFSDGGEFTNTDRALRRAEEMITEGADIVDIGGESTRPGSTRVSAEEEIRRVGGVVKAIADRFDIPISIDTTKHEVAFAALDAGAEIINDISGLRWDPGIANVAAETGAGLVLMHSRGEFETMHTQPPVENIFTDVAEQLRQAIRVAKDHGVSDEQIVLDVGIGFGKTPEQNLELLADLDKIVDEFKNYPVMIGASRKSFLGKIAAGAAPDARLGGSLAAALLAASKGAQLVRVHDIGSTVHALAVARAVDGK
jgi:dihydropteroate synthase